MGLRERDDERLLPVGHEAGMHVGLDHHGLEVAARVVEADAVFVDVELAADLAEDVEERHQLLLLRAGDEDVALGRERGGRPARGLVAVEQRTVLVAFELLDALDEDDTVRLDVDDRAHLLQDRDEIHNLGLDRRVLELGHALCEHRGEQHLLRRADAGVGQLDVRAAQSVGGGESDALVALVDDGTEGPQRVEVEVDGAVADSASAEVRDERLTETVQQRPAEQDRDTAGAGQRVDLVELRLEHVRRVEQQLALADLRDRDAVCLEHARDDTDITDRGNITQDARGVGQQGRDHRLGREVLRSAHVDAALERLATVDDDLVRQQSHALGCLLGILGQGTHAHLVLVRAGRGPRAYFAGRVVGRHDSRRSSNAVMAASSRSVKPMSSSPSSRRHLV